MTGRPTFTFDMKSSSAAKKNIFYDNCANKHRKYQHFLWLKYKVSRDRGMATVILTGRNF